MLDRVRSMLVIGTLALLVCSALPGSAAAQAVAQSQLTTDDVDPTFSLGYEHLAGDLRWLGLAPRQITWSPDGKWIYFRWREDPQAGQHPDTDPWLATEPNGRSVRLVSTDEVARIPSGNIEYASDRRVAAWTTGGTLYLWTQGDGVRAVYTSASSLSNFSLSPDGSRAFFATQGGRGSSEQITQQSSDLWIYEVGSSTARQIAAAREKTKEPSDQDAWLQDQQLELIEIVAKRKRDSEVSDSVRRATRANLPQTVPVEKDALAYNLQLSPDGRFLTFQWIKDQRREHRTSYMEFVNEEGQAVERPARPKVGEAMPTYKMGIVRLDPTVEPDSVQVIWVDPGTEKDAVVHGPYWNPQGTHAVVQILSMDHKDRWLSLLDLESGATSVIDHQQEEAWIGGPLVGGRWSPGYLQWLPDGQSFGFVSTATGWAMLYLADVAGGVQQLTAGEFEVRRAALSPNGKTWYLETSKEHPGEEHLYHLPARGGELERITTGEGMHRAFHSPDGRRIAVVFETRSQLPDLYVMQNKPGAEKRQVTRSGTDDFFRYDWADSEIIIVPNEDGLESWAEVYEPPDQHNGAAVIYVHGCGECAQGVTKGWRRVRTRLYANYMRRRGYVSANFDYRGSSGYGHANRTYAYRQMGITDVDSSLPFLEILSRRYGVDPDRIGVYGGSYGGFFTLMALFRHPGKYAAGVSLYPVTDWAHYNSGYTSRILNGSQLDDEEAYRVSSPIYYAEGLADALMIQHGLVDGNVQIQDSFRLAQVLIELEKDFDLVVYPMEDHGWDEVPTRIDSYKRMTRWFDRYLLGAGVATSAPTPTGGR